MSMKDKPGRPPRSEGGANKPGAKTPKTQKDTARARKMSPRDVGQALIRDRLTPGGDGGPVSPGNAPGYGQGTLAEMPVVGGPNQPVPKRTN